MSILITTYEGTHNHPLAVAATAMASTTSAAASILLSGSSTSQAGLSSSAPSTMITTNLNGLNFTLYNNSNTGQFNLPSSSSPTPPTITLDLTCTPPSHFNKTSHITSNNFLQSPSHYSSRSLDFSSETKTIFPISWSNTNSLNYGLLPLNKPPMGSINFGKPTHNEPILSHAKFLERINQATTSSSSSQQLLTETLTKVLTSDPSFQSAVAAAISSMVGSNNNNITHINRASSESSTQNLKWVDQVQGISTSPLSHHHQNGKGCAPTFLNQPTSSTSKAQSARNFMFLQPPFPFSLSKSSSSTNLRD